MMQEVLNKLDEAYCLLQEAIKVNQTKSLEFDSKIIAVDKMIEELKKKEANVELEMQALILERQDSDKKLTDERAKMQRDIFVHLARAEKDVQEAEKLKLALDSKIKEVDVLKDKLTNQLEQETDRLVKEKLAKIVGAS